MKRTAIMLVTMGVLLVFATPAKAQVYFGIGGSGGGYGGYGNYNNYGGYGNGYGGYNNGYGGYGNNGGNGQFGSYFGNGGHDLQPHLHVTQTPYGSNVWYGNGPHDLVPHQHSQTPWSYQGYSNTAAGPTTSFYNPQPYYFSAW